MAVKCEMCSREFKTTQGLRGHKTFVHQLTRASAPAVRLVTEQQSSKLEERVEQLTSKLELLEARSSDLNTRVDIQAEQLKHLGEHIFSDGAHCLAKDLRIDQYKHDLEQLAERYEKLNRFIQYEFAGIQDNILWEIYLMRAESKKPNYKPKQE